MLTRRAFVAGIGVWLMPRVQRNNIGTAVIVEPGSITGAEVTAINATLASHTATLAPLTTPGEAGDVLTVVGGVPSWVPPTSGDGGTAEPTTLSASAQYNLALVRRWIAWLDGAPGLIGEIGWPNSLNQGANPTHTAYQDDWNAVGEAVYRELDKAGAWATYFIAGGASLDPQHVLGVYTGSPSMDTAQPQAAVIEQHQTTASYQRGVNVNVHDYDEFGGWTRVLPTADDWAYLGSRGVTLARIHLGPDDFLTAPGGTVKASFTAAYNTLLTQAAANGIGVILLMNYDAGAFGDDDILHVTDGNWTQADLIDLWRKLSDLYKADSRVVAYAIGNEPHDMLAIAGTGFTASGTSWTFDANTTGWSVSGATPNTAIAHNTTTTHTGAGSMRVTVNGATDGYGIVISGATGGTGTILNAWIYYAAEVTPGGMFARIRHVASGVNSPEFAMVPGTWVNVQHEFASSASTAIEIQFLPWTNMGGNNAVFYVDDVGQGTTTNPPLTAAEHWEAISQAVVTDLRTTKSDTKTIIVPTYNWGNISNAPTEHANGPWIVDPEDNVRYDSHIYFDHTTGSAYTRTFAAVNADAVTAGYTDGVPPGIAERGDTLIVDPADGDVLTYDATTGFWRNVAGAP